MSQHTSRTSRPRRTSTTTTATRSFSLPVWATTLIMMVALAAGTLLSLRAQSLGWPYLIIFAVVSVLVTIFVEVRGLVLTVGQIPLLFGIATPLSAWLVNSTIANTPQGLSTTAILTAVYPLAQYFPILGWVTVGCSIIAGLRLWQFKRTMTSRSLTARQERRQNQEADLSNRETASRARRLSSRTPTATTPVQEQAEDNPRKLSVEELRRKQNEQQPQQQQPKRTVQRPQRTQVQSPPTMVIPPVKAAPKTGAHQRSEEEPRGRHEQRQRPPRRQPQQRQPQQLRDEQHPPKKRTVRTPRPSGTQSPQQEPQPRRYATRQGDAQAQQPRTVQRRPVRKMTPRRDAVNRDHRRTSRHDDLY